MSITFHDVKRHAEPTYFFMSNTAVTDLDICLKAAGESDYEFHTSDQFPAVLPSSVTIPTVKLVDLPGCDRICRRPVVLVSHMDTEHLRRKLQQILRGENAELQERKAANSKAAIEDYDQNHAWHEGQILVSPTKE